MKHNRLISVWVVMFLALTGCDVAREAPPEQKETVFDDQIRAIDKAKAVEDLNEERLKKLRDAESRQAGDDGTGG